MSNTAVPAKVHTFVASTLADPTKVNKNFDDLFAEFANIGRANIIADGVGTTQLQASSVTLAKLAAAVLGNLVPTGAMLPFAGSTIPATWTDYFVFCTGTIGSAASGATTRANADTETLFTLLWNSMADAQAAVSGGRGASAAADFAANKTIALPAVAGRAFFGKESSESLITTAVSGFTGATLGVVGGAQSVTLDTTMIPSHNHSGTDSGHTHSITDPTHTHGYNAPNGTTLQIPTGGANAAVTTQVSTNTNAASTGITGTNSGTANITIGATGGGAAHRNMPPAYICNVIIKL
jgi:microcystin-dependent protein